MRTLTALLFAVLLGCEAPDSADSAAAPAATPAAAARPSAPPPTHPTPGGAAAGAMASPSFPSGSSTLDAFRAELAAAAAPKAPIAEAPAPAPACTDLPPERWPADPPPDDAAWPIPAGRRPTRVEESLLAELRRSGGRWYRDPAECPVVDPYQNAGEFALGGVGVGGGTSRQEIVAEELAKDPRLLLTMMRDPAPAVRAYAGYHLLRAGHPASAAILARTMADPGRMMCQSGCLGSTCIVNRTVYENLVGWGSYHPLPPAALATLETVLRAHAETLDAGPRETALADVAGLDARQAEARRWSFSHPPR